MAEVLGDSVVGQERGTGSERRYDIIVTIEIQSEQGFPFPKSIKDP